MLRFIILFGFTYFFIRLHASGDISKYINMKYSYLSFSMIFVMAFLSIYQLIKWVREGDKKEDSGHDHEHNHDHEHHHHHDDHGHDHSHDENTFLKKVFVYGLLAIPLITGIFLPVATLNSTIVKAKGFHFSILDTGGDQYANHQVLRPNSSLYYGKDEYASMEKKDLKAYGSKQKVNLTDANYFRALESIYNYPGNYMNKNITLKGFAYRTGELKQNQLYLLRFGIIHCIADAGVYGMMVDFPKNIKAKENTWIQVNGTLGTAYNQQFQQSIPYIKVTSWKTIDQPKDPYVYRKYN